VKILAGVTPLKSMGMARHMRDNVAGLTVPDYWLERLEKAVDKPAEGIRMCVEQIERLREIEGVAGVHVMAIEWEEKVGEIVKAAGLLPRPEPAAGQGAL
jgi:methylenetetrahydrofolate reductase (NADPH)